MGKGPDFIGIGQQKAGTGWLYDQLSRHPSVWMPPIKEIKFVTGDPFRDAHKKWLRDFEIYSEGFWRHPFAYFGAARRIPTNRSGEQYTSRGHLDLDLNFWRHYAKAAKSPEPNPQWYLDALETPEGIHSGDISPNYSTAPLEQVEFAKAILPDARIIFLVRHPVARAKSAISMAVRRGRKEAGLVDDWVQLKAFLDSGHFSKRSNAPDAWKRWTDIFGSAQCGYWLLDEIIGEPDATRNAILDFLGLEAVDLPIRADHNRKAKAGKAEFSSEIEKRLRDYFEDEINECARVFGRSAADW